MKAHLGGFWDRNVIGRKKKQKSKKASQSGGFSFVDSKGVEVTEEAVKRGLL